MIGAIIIGLHALAINLTISTKYAKCVEACTKVTFHHVQQVSA